MQLGILVCQRSALVLYKWSEWRLNTDRYRISKKTNLVVMSETTSSEFPTFNEFEEESPTAAENSEPAIPWRELETNKVFEVIDIRNINIRGGRRAIILTLQAAGKNIVNMWATSIVIKHIDEKKATWESSTKQYIIIRGKKTSKDGREYYDQDYQQVNFYFYINTYCSIVISNCYCDENY